jgi:hypothetical protein
VEKAVRGGVFRGDCGVCSLEGDDMLVNEAECSRSAEERGLNMKASQLGLKEISVGNCSSLFQSQWCPQSPSAFLSKNCQRKANPRRLTLAPDAEKGKTAAIYSQEDEALGLEQEGVRDGSMELMSFVFHCVHTSSARASDMNSVEGLRLGRGKARRGPRKEKDPHAHWPSVFHQGRWEWIRRGVNFARG